MKNILLCPLDWGMGHATRLRSIAWRLHNKGHNVIVAASEPLLKVFDDSVCSQKIVFSSLPIRYSKKLPQYLVILLQAPLLLIQFLSDHYRTGWLAKRYKADIVISDNRFGCFTSRAHSVYITHQLNIKVPGRTKLFARMLSSIHGWIASSYNECWIPDIPLGLAGDLTIHSHKLNTRYTGILSMLSTCEESSPGNITREGYYAVLISGPEPQRSLLEEKLLAKLSESAERFVIAGGKAGGEGERERGREGVKGRGREGERERGSEGVKGREGVNIWYYDYLRPGEIKYILKHSKGVICRSGYSTLMDLAMLGKGAIVIPTPGQTEQEYLAEELDRKGWVKMYKQGDIDKIDISKIPEPGSYDNIRDESEALLNKALDKLLTTPSSR